METKMNKAVMGVSACQPQIDELVRLAHQSRDLTARQLGLMD